MADASRFPQLALPFAIVGAAGGWLSAAFVSNPLVQRFQWDPRAPAVIAGALFAALAGWILTRWSTREEPDWPEELEGIRRRPRAVTKRWPVQALPVLAAGALTGVVVAVVGDVYNGVSLGALVGTGCAAAFLPVCLAVVAAARRAQRARLGSLVSGSDRRAVWGILATALSAATLEALPGWPAWAAGEMPAPWPAAGMLVVCGGLIGGVLIADLRGRRVARGALAAELEPQEPGRLAAVDTRIPRLDLGLGEGVAARMTRTSAAYRGQDRPLALVQGDAELAMAAFRRAMVRGGAGLAVVGITACAHVSAQGAAPWLEEYHEQRCEAFSYRSCHRLAEAVERRSPERALALYERACGSATAESCVAAAGMHLERGNEEKADWLYGRACRYGAKGGCLGMAR